MSRLVVCLTLASIALAVPVEEHKQDSLSAPTVLIQSDVNAMFDAWTSLFGKTYKTEEQRNAAKKAFAENNELIAQLNDENNGAFFSHNQFSDLTAEQFRRTYLPKKMDANEGKRGGRALQLPTMSDIPTTFDWRDFNAVSPVKDQGACGCCWADSAVQNIESVVYLAANPPNLRNDVKTELTNSTGPTPLSVEQVIECDAFDYACYGGYPSKAFQYIIEQGGLATEASYPFDVDGKVICLANQTFNMTCGDGMCDDPPLTSYCDLTCSVNQHNLSVSISSFVTVGENETEIAAVLATKNPLSVALDARWLQFYKGGVGNPRFCSANDLDHAVLLVGYGEQNGTPYWTVKNSWGESWGENGYFRIVRGEGKCGINTMVTSAVL